MKFEELKNKVKVGDKILTKEIITEIKECEVQEIKENEIIVLSGNCRFRVEKENSDRLDFELIPESLEIDGKKYLKSEILECIKDLKSIE